MQIKSGRDSNVQFGGKSQMTVGGGKVSKDGMVKKITIGVIITVLGSLIFFLIQKYFLS